MNLAECENLFGGNFATRGEVGAAISIWESGREVLHLAGGFRDRDQTQPWTPETPVLIYSATKGLAAACVLHTLEKRALPLETRVAEFWPEFAAAGKEAITIAEVLSHRAGLCALDEVAPVTDYEAVIAAIEKQAPLWPRGDGHGYHPRTFGFLLDEIVRRLTGETLGDYWREHFGAPLGLDTWIGLPPSKLPAMANMQAARGIAPETPFSRELATSGSFSQRAFSSPRGLHSVSAMNTPEARTGSFPGFGGISTARSLAKFYAMLAAGGVLGGERFFAEATIAQMGTELTSGFDRVLQIETAFSAGFMKDPVDAAGKKRRSLFGPSRLAFGQPGAGGSVAFADPERGLAFAYVMNQMEAGVLPNEKSLRIIAALYR